MAVPRRKEQSRVGSVALVDIAMMASIAFTSLIPSPANAADASQLANGALCAPSDQKFGEEQDTADPDKGIATYVGGDMYVGKKPSTGVDAEGNITLSSSNAPDVIRRRSRRPHRHQRQTGVTSTTMRARTGGTPVTCGGTGCGCWSRRWSQRPRMTRS